MLSPRYLANPLISPSSSPEVSHLQSLSSTPALPSAAGPAQDKGPGCPRGRVLAGVSLLVVGGHEPGRGPSDLAPPVPLPFLASSAHASLSLALGVLVTLAFSHAVSQIGTCSLRVFPQTVPLADTTLSLCLHLTCWQSAIRFWLNVSRTLSQPPRRGWVPWLPNSPSTLSASWYNLLPLLCVFPAHKGVVGPTPT